MSNLSNDCRKLIQLKSDGMVMLDFIAELELLDFRYPGLGFLEESDWLRAWLDKRNKMD